MIDLSEDDEAHFFPHIYHAAITFKIFIPNKVQERLEAICDTEHFRVTIYHHYYMPVTYVSGPASEFPSFNTSRSVVLVRRYLEEKIGLESDFKSDCIGPSPFHADFITSNTMLSGKLLDITNDVGYKRYLFGCDKSYDGGLSEFYNRFGDTFSLFYYLQHLRSGILDAERKTVETTNALLAESKSGGWFARMRGSIRSGRLIDEINEAGLEDQLYRSYIASALDEAEKEEPTDRFQDLAYHFNELRRFTDPRQNPVIKDIVETSEKRRQGLFQNITVLIAGLVGGVLGAILGSALTYSLTADRHPSLHETNRMARPTIGLPNGMKLMPFDSPTGYCIAPPRPQRNLAVTTNAKALPQCPSSP